MLYVSVKGLVVVGAGKPNELPKSKTQRTRQEEQDSEDWNRQKNGRQEPQPLAVSCFLTGETKSLLSVLSGCLQTSLQSFHVAHQGYLKEQSQPSQPLWPLGPMAIANLAWIFSTPSKRSLKQKKELSWTSWVRYSPLIQLIMTREWADMAQASLPEPSYFASSCEKRKIF